MGLSLRFNEDEEKIFKSYAKVQGEPLSKLFKEAMMEKIEEEHDLNVAEEAMKAYQKDKKTYTLSEAKKILGIE